MRARQKEGLRVNKYIGCEQQLYGVEVDFLETAAGRILVPRVEGGDV